jgi:hypothetical protein
MRGTTLQTQNRFETRTREAFDDGWETVAEELPVIQTQFLDDHAKSILFTIAPIFPWPIRSTCIAAASMDVHTAGQGPIMNIWDLMPA